jgi:hypothetical protein
MCDANVKKELCGSGELVFDIGMVIRKAYMTSSSLKNCRNRNKDSSVKPTAVMACALSEDLQRIAWPRQGGMCVGDVDCHGIRH